MRDVTLEIAIVEWAEAESEVENGDVSHEALMRKARAELRLLELAVQLQQENNGRDVIPWVAENNALKQATQRHDYAIETILARRRGDR